MARTSRLSARMSDLSPFQVVETMERAWQAERAGRRIVRLEAGEPDFGTPLQVIEAVSAAMATGEVHYTSSLGLPALRDAIAASYAERYGVVISPERVIVTTGASAALVVAFAATIDASAQVLMSDPGYPCNRNILRVLEGATVAIPVSAQDNYQLCAPLVAEHWGERARGVLIGTPSNPTGSVMDPAEFGRILSFVERAHGVVFVDEVYGELVYGRKPTTSLSLSDDVFVINSFSKQFGMTGFRLGWLVCPDWATEAMKVLTQNLYISPPMPSQIGGLAALTPEVWDIVEVRRQAFEARRDVLVKGLREIGFGIPVTPEGGFYVYADCSAFSQDSARFVLDVLDHADVALTPGNDFGSHGANVHVRFSYTTSLENIEDGLERLARYLNA